MPGVDDVKVLSRELSQLHSLLNEKEGSWDDKFRDITLKLGELHRENGSLIQQLSYYKSREDESEDKINSDSTTILELRQQYDRQQLVIRELQIENKNMAEEVSKLNTQVKLITDSNDAVNEELLNYKIEQAKLDRSVQSDISNNQLINELEERLSRTSLEKEQLINKMGTEAITDILIQ